MASKVLLELKVDDKGSLKIVQKEAQSAAAATDRLSKSTKNVSRARSQYHKQEKGVGQAGLSSAKSFSKLNQTIGSGSSGLVGAYAILAANVFAATAAFGVFQRAAQFDDLIRGLEFVGNAAGRNLPEVSKRLKEITNDAISTESAMRATALATGAGFSTIQLEGLTKIAKGASIALGRDLTDALDRLVRGTAKLEPEILDELGIMVRLDKAVQNYASQLNVAKDSLTEFDRRQAFLNETLKQGEKKYFDIADAIDTNPYDKLAASLSNLQKTIVGFVNNTLNLSGGINFLSNNVTALGAVAVALGSTLSKSIAPALFNLDKSAAASADAFAQQKLAMLDTLGVADKMPARYAAALGPIKDGVGTVEDFQQAQDSLAASDKKYNELKEKQKGLVETAEKAKSKSEKGTRKLGVVQSRLNKLQQAALAGDKKEAARQIEKLKNLQKGNTITGKFIRSIETRSASELKSREVQKGLEKTQARVTEQVDKAALAQERYNKSIERGAQLSAGYDQSLSNNELRYRELDEVQQAQTASTAKHTRAQAIGEAASLSLFTAFSTLKDSINSESESNKRNAEGKSRLTKIFSGLKTMVFGVSGGFRVLLAAFMAVLPYIGYIATGITVLFALFKDKFLPRDIIKDRADEAVASFQQFADVQDQFAKRSGTVGDKLGNAYIALSGILDQVNTKLVDIVNFVSETAIDEIVNLTTQLDGLRKQIAERAKGPMGGRDGQNTRKKEQRQAKELEQDITDIQNSIAEKQVVAANTVLTGALAELEVRQEMAKLRKSQSTNPTDFVDVFAIAEAETSIKAIAALQTKMNKDMAELDDTLSGEERQFEVQKIIIAAQNEMQSIMRVSKNVASAFQATETSVSEANNTISKFQQSVKEPFEDVQNAVLGVSNNFTIFRQELAELDKASKNGGLDKVQTARFNELNLLLEDVEGNLDQLNIAERFKKGEDGLVEFNKEVIRIRNNIKTFTTNIATMEQVTKSFAKSTKAIKGAEANTLNLEQALIKERIKLVNERLSAEEILFAKTKENADERVRLTKELAKLEAQELTPGEIKARQRKKEVIDLERINALEIARGKTTLARAKLLEKLSSAGGRLTPASEVEFAAQTADLKIQAAQRELEMALVRLDVERAILSAQFKRIDSQDEAGLGPDEAEALRLLSEQRTQVQEIGREKILQARIAKQEQTRASSEATTGVGVASLPPQQAAIIKSQRQVQAALTAQHIAEEGLTQLKDKQLDQQLEMHRLQSLARETETPGDLASAAQAEKALKDTENLITIQNQLVNESRENFKQSQIQNTVAVLQGTAEAFRAMGPEGEMGAALASAQATLLGSVNSSLEIIKKTEGKGAEATQARLAIAGAALSTFGSIAAAASNQRISAIDKEIEAEKKRDGKSKDSLAKIKALEGKKDAMARKAFERNKKIQMASTVVNTASAVMGILGNESGKIGVGAIVLAALVGAMGAAQLAIISGQSYQGGASSTGAGGMASAVTVGSRGNSVDVGRSQS
ncbi:MAG: hypothetical protein CML56_08525, partial [Rhodobacteraceae bacterium]|nr:hypothetical protein [Paracoccaceae bacterium]